VEEEYYLAFLRFVEVLGEEQKAILSRIAEIS
jgi:hypothetical protein